MLRFLKRLHREERGQGLLFGVVSLFILCLCTAMVHNLGQVTSTRTRVQAAADSAALAGALVEADIGSSIAWMNDGMAYVYYHLMRYAVDLTVYGTLREFKLHDDLIFDLPEISDDHLGVPDIDAKFMRAYNEAAHWIPKGEEWLEKISAIEEGLLIAGPILIKQEIFRVAKECGAEYTTIWPDIDLWGGDDSELTILIEKLSNGWRLTASNGYSCEVIKTGPEHWQITVNTGLVVSLGKIADNPTTYEIETNDGTRLRATELPGIGWAVTGVAEGKSISYYPVPTYGEGAYKITSGGGSVIVRPGPGGTEQYVGGKWVPLTSQDSINVGGTEIPINHTGAIHAGGAEIYLPNRIVLNNTEIVLNSDDVDLYTHIGMAEVRIETDEVVVNRLSNKYHADGKWRTWVHPGRRYATGGTWRHRMTEEGPTTWTYEYQKQGPHFATEDDYKRFGILHAVFDNEAYDPENPDTMKRPLWMKWFQPEHGCSLNREKRNRETATYHQTRTCWHPKDLWCPVHGLACAPNGIRPCGFWHEVDPDTGKVREIKCSCCNNNNGEFGYYYQTGEDFDGDGKTDVRFYQYDSRHHRNRPRLTPQITDYDIDPPLDLQSIRLSQVARPKVLREEFFQFQINVGCWIGPQTSDSLQLLFEDPPWGFFAVASARSGFHDVTTGKYRYTFDTIEDRDKFLEDSANMYEPDWQARLYSSVKNIKEEDLDTLPGVETPVNWIYKGMAWYANWRNEYNGLPNKSVNASLRRMYRPESVDDFFDPVHLVGTRENPYRGNRFDLSDLRFKDTVKH